MKRRALRLTAISLSELAAVVAMGTSARNAVADGFVDVTTEVGINHVQSIWDEDQPGTEAIRFTGGAAAGDFDGDGWTDLYVTRMGFSDILYRNVGGQFVDVTTSAFGPLHLRSIPSNGASWADIDNDGDLDLYVTALQVSRYFLFVNDGNGSFTEQAVDRGASTNSPQAFKTGMSVAVGDYDVDGYLDLFTSDWASLQNDGTTQSRLLRNLGSQNPGHFEDKTAAAGLSYNAFQQGGSALRTWGFSPRFADMDNDGLPDLTLAADFGTSKLFWNDGDGTFTNGTEAANVGTDENGMGSTIADYDGDGDLDWFVTSIFDPTNTCSDGTCNWGTTGNRLYRNNGDRTFTDQTDAKGVRNAGWGWGTSWFDYDNDGDQDLIMTNGIDFPHVDQDAMFNIDQTTIWRNNGDGSVFTNVSDDLGVTDVGNGKGLLVFDYDNDGDQDAFIVNHAGQPILYRNDVGDANDYLRIDLTGTDSNRDGIGAKITVTADLTEPDNIQYHEVSGGSNFLSQNETTAHFGLGSMSGTLDRVEIRWPSGIVQVFDDVAPNQTLDVIEAAFALVLGDMDGSGGVDAFDVDDFELALADPAAYAQLHPAIDASLVGDMTGDGVLDAFDISDFETLLAGGAAATVVPEPSSVALLALAGAFTARPARRSGRTAPARVARRGIQGIRGTRPPRERFQ